MKRRLSLWVTFAALALRLVLPSAAYAAPASFLGDICSARSAARATEESSKSPAHPPAGAHRHGHCDDGCCGALAAALPAACALPLPPATAARVDSRFRTEVVAAAPAALPPPRGPPRSAC